jgi:hypothetical protein
MANGFEEPADNPLEPAETTDEQYFFALMTSANNSGANGVAFLTLDPDDKTLTIDAAALGLEPNQEHPFHIHGFADDQPSKLPTIDQDTDLDGFVESPEGEPVFGPVILPLTQDDPEDDTQDDPETDALAPPVDDTPQFPVADANGVVEFTETYQFDLNDPAQAASFSELADGLEGHGIQFHGLELPAGAGEGTDNEVNGSGGYIAGLPVANGIIYELPAGLTPKLLDTFGITALDVADFFFA